jgi:DNA-binding response OmpR family regulator
MLAIPLVIECSVDAAVARVKWRKSATWLADKAIRLLTLTFSMQSALIIEDDFTSAKVLAMILERNGYYVLIAANSDEASDFCGDIKIDLIVADIILRSPLSGTDVACRLRQSCPEVPILFVSGTPLEGWSDHDLSNIEQLLSSRVGFVMKPFTAGGLITDIKSLLDGGYSGRDITGQVETARKFRNDRPLAFRA